MSSTSEALKPFVVGGTSAMLASSVVHPIDLAKVRLQLFSVQNPGIDLFSRSFCIYQLTSPSYFNRVPDITRKPSFAGILSKMVKEDGIQSIYSGLSASLYGTGRFDVESYPAENAKKDSRQ
jgi:solute carrier family 25 oxoglutarate transporter 11